MKLEEILWIKNKFKEYKPINFFIMTNGIFVSTCACLAHMYMENQGWTHFTTLFTPVDPYREFRHIDPGF